MRLSLACPACGRAPACAHSASLLDRRFSGGLILYAARRVGPGAVFGSETEYLKHQLDGAHVATCRKVFEAYTGARWRHSAQQAEGMLLDVAGRVLLTGLAAVGCAAADQWSLLQQQRCALVCPLGGVVVAPDPSVC